MDWTLWHLETDVANGDKMETYCSQKENTEKLQQMETWIELHVHWTIFWLET